MRYPAPDPRRSPAELLEAVIAAYLEAADAREAPPREELLARGEVQIWDLGRIRPALRELNLDWEGPPRLEPPEEAGAAPVRVEIVAEERTPGADGRALRKAWKQ